jgi:hypothetical protein
MSVRCFAWGLLITASAWAIGCGSGRPPVYPVQGQVRWKKQIPEGAHVVFHPVGKTGTDVVRPAGLVDRDGKFVLTTYAAGDGAPAGDYDVTVEWWVSPGRDLPAVNKLPAAYARAESSRMQVKVVPGTNELQPFELK